MMEIKHKKEERKYVLELPKGLEAYVEYIANEQNELMLVHSEVPYQLRGQGIGEKLVLKTFEKLTEEGYTAKAICGYIRKVAVNHDKWNKIIR